MTEDLNERVVELETFVAHQDEVVRDLSDMISRQWDTIDRLERKVRRLEESLRSVEGRIDEGAPPEPPPPHY